MFWKVFRKSKKNYLQNTFTIKPVTGPFQEIMAMPEYYLTKCELDIFKNKKEDLTAFIATENEPFDLIELGAGDAMKIYLFAKIFSRKQ